MFWLGFFLSEFLLLVFLVFFLFFFNIISGGKAQNEIISNKISLNKGLFKVTVCFQTQLTATKNHSMLNMPKRMDMLHLTAAPHMVQVAECSPLTVEWKIKVGITRMINTRCLRRSNITSAPSFAYK